MSLLQGKVLSKKSLTLFSTLFSYQNNLNSQIVTKKPLLPYLFKNPVGGLKMTFKKNKTIK
jgi:hypothetical protein